MKVAVSSRGPDLESPVDPRFGRCAYFIIVDPETREFEAVANPGVQAAHGAGTQAAQVVGSRGVGAVITGNIGPNPMRAPSAAGIEVYAGAGGTVAQALDAYVSGNLTKVSSPTVATHSGLGRGGGGGRRRFSTS